MKELKAEFPPLRIILRCDMWNPVKELKGVIRAEHVMYQLVLVESGEGIES